MAIKEMRCNRAPAILHLFPVSGSMAAGPCRMLRWTDACPVLGTVCRLLRVTTASLTDKYVPFCSVGSGR